MLLKYWCKTYSNGLNLARFEEEDRFVIDEESHPNVRWYQQLVCYFPTGCADAEISAFIIFTMGDQGCADAEISASIACTNYWDQLAYRGY